MPSHSQVQAVQQEIDSVKAEIQDTKQELAAAEQAGDGAKVDFLRNRLQLLDMKENNLREEKNILLKAQATGQPCLLCLDLLNLLVHIMWGLKFPHCAVPSL